MTTRASAPCGEKRVGDGEINTPFLFIIKKPADLLNICFRNNLKILYS